MKKIALITGASSGIGHELARQLARRGDVDELWLVARREDRLRDVASEVMIYAHTRIFLLDLADVQAVAHIKDALRGEGRRVSWLVNAAGFGKIGRVDMLTAEEQIAMVDVNCRALTGLTAAVLPYMARGGHILNVASAAAFMPQPDFAVYAASKAYVLSFSRGLHCELAPRHVTVTALCPGPVNTEFFDVAEEKATMKGYKKRLMADCQAVCRGAVSAAVKGKPVYVPTVTFKVFRVLTSLPHTLLLAFAK